MNEDIFAGQWKQLKGHVREKWGDLTDDEVDQIQGKGEILVGKLQETYGYTRRQAENEIRNFVNQFEEV